MRRKRLKISARQGTPNWKANAAETERCLSIRPVDCNDAGPDAGLTVGLVAHRLRIQPLVGYPGAGMWWPFTAGSPADAAQAARTAGSASSADVGVDCISPAGLIAVARIAAGAAIADSHSHPDRRGAGPPARVVVQPASLRASISVASPSSWSRVQDDTSSTGTRPHPAAGCCEDLVMIVA